jgi:hypothetical protein
MVDGMEVNQPDIVCTLDADFLASMTQAHELLWRMPSMDLLVYLFQNLKVVTTLVSLPYLWKIKYIFVSLYTGKTGPIFAKAS